jgi:ADP-ribose pyrophosphatase
MKRLLVKRKKIRLPNGYCTRIELVIHPGAVVIVPFLSSGKVLILRQFRPALDKYLYELPAGTIEGQETPFSCARREIVEETGYLAARLMRLGFIYPVPGYSTEKITIFKATGLKRKQIRLEKDEVITVMETTKSKIRELFKKGALVDAKSICALGMCGWL